MPDEKTPEVWKPIPGFDGYKASSLGRILGKKRTVLKTWKETRPDRVNYEIAKLRVDGSYHSRTVSRLVCLAFHGLPPDVEEDNPRKWSKFDASHLNDDPMDNRPENLEWEWRTGNRGRTYLKGDRKRQVDGRFKR